MSQSVSAPKGLKGLSHLSQLAQAGKLRQGTSQVSSDRSTAQICSGGFCLLCLLVFFQNSKYSAHSVAQLAKLRTHDFSSGHDLRVMPHMCLCAQQGSRECACPSPSAPPTTSTGSLSLK